MTLACSQNGPRMGPGLESSNGMACMVCMVGMACSPLFFRYFFSFMMSDVQTKKSNLPGYSSASQEFAVLIFNAAYPKI